MIVTSPLNRLSFLTAGCAIAIFAFTPVIRAQSDQAKMAGAIPITLELLDKIDKFTKAVSSDPATTAEWNASSKDPAISSEAPAPVIDAKYPKLAAAFKAANLPPEDFVKAYGAILVTGVIAELDKPSGDKNADANIAFYKANKDRATATMNSLEALDRGTNPSPSAAPSASPASSS